MSFLKTISRDQRIKITSLPYRVGLWVSQSDSSGGEEADARERQVLENLIEGFTQEVFGSESVQHIMTDTLAQKDKWPEWAAKPGNVLEDCRQALSILRDHVDEKEVSAFCQRLLEIGEAVALAFGEGETAGFKHQMLTSAEYYSEWFFARVKGKDFMSLERYRRISRAEREALRELSHALGKVMGEY
ncbi:MAG: hypothetical protein LRZ85_09960 [Alphaproteobacteria bacterium]|nr:hypothetical protein [Alphaproteobacteria bacterium]MCD8520442.1 hypothetical protein [Alphaproteobacteria bacterium]MCD8571129.1 hypothetical protein [Alphaproteobacteria bacterium]